LLELTQLQALVLPESGALQLQLRVTAEQEKGQWKLSLYGREETAIEAGGAWVEHASGTLSASVEESASEGLEQWPPLDAEALDSADLYERLGVMGLVYGEAFRGLEAVYRAGDDVYAKVRLPPAVALEASAYGLHPALLDAALHALCLCDRGGGVELPFAWSDVWLQQTGASALRVRISLKQGHVSLSIADESGSPVGAVQALYTRSATPAQMRAVARSADDLYRLEWVAVPAPVTATVARPWALLAADEPSYGLREAASAVYAGLGALQEALDAGAIPPQCVVLACNAELPAGITAGAQHASRALLETLQAWLSDKRLSSSRLVVVTQRSVAVATHEDVLDLARAPLWGLVRSAQTEHPGRFRIVDVDRDTVLASMWAAILAADEPQLALRDGSLRAARLQAGPMAEELAIPSDTTAWSMQLESEGTFQGLRLRSEASAHRALERGEVRVALRASGLNFRDVLSALGLYPGDPGPLGGEGAGVVLEVGEGVTELVPGDSVMGLIPRAFASVAVTDQRTLIRIPDGMSYTQAAGIPITFLTAYYALVDLAKLEPGETVLVHAAAGGVGMAATQLARHLGAEVFGTASEPKWPVLRGLGFDDEHLASSRTLDFEGRFRMATRGLGVDVVLDSLAGEFVDASLRLLADRGRFIEMGKTDIREPEQLTSVKPGAMYRAFDVSEAGPDRIAQMLSELVRLFALGVLQPLPTTCWDIRRAPEAFRFMGQARHVGKVVLAAPPAPQWTGTVLITGGTGALGSLVARHLVAAHGVKQLVLCSRSGGGEALREELERAGACVTIAACDVSDREALRAVLQAIPAEHPLRGVVHTAGILDDGVLESQSSERIDRVFAAKLAGAVHLDELTRQLDLAHFVLFSSVAGITGAPGQANYAAANTFLDALAHRRRARGLAATALAWGPWSGGSGMTKQLSESDHARVARSGMRALPGEAALELFDAALTRCEPLLVAAALDKAALAAQRDALPALLQGLVGPMLAPSRARAGSSLRRHLKGLDAAARQQALLELVVTEVSVVLSVNAKTIEAHSPLELDSLMALELRNRLNHLTGLKLPPTAIFNHPTPDALARMLYDELRLGAHDEVEDEERQIRKLFASISIDRLRKAGLIELLLDVAKPSVEPAVATTEQAIDAMSSDELVSFVIGQARAGAGQPRSSDNG
jgi:NADPH:quinone reductase-like Zn-dependent oxidoreductase/acyl carrier protein